MADGEQRLLEADGSVASGDFRLVERMVRVSQQRWEVGGAEAVGRTDAEAEPGGEVRCREFASSLVQPLADRGCLGDRHSGKENHDLIAAVSPDDVIDS